MHGLLAGDQVTACEFRTAHDVTLWPIEVTSASYFSFAPDLPLNTLPVGHRIKGGIRIRLKTTAGVTFSQMTIDRLPFYLAGRADVANTLYELCLGSALGALVMPSASASRAYEFLPAGSFRQVGFADDQALLPVTLRGFQGYRLLQEYFSLAERYRFFELSGLARGLRQAADEAEIVILLGRGEHSLEGVVDGSNVALFCTPAVNLFPKRADRVHLGDDQFEYHVVADRTRPLDFEIYDVTRVVGHGAGSEGEQQFLPFYSSYCTRTDLKEPAYFTLRREPRLVGATEARRGPRSSYIGSEVFLALVDPEQAPFSADLRQLSIRATCTNRDLPLLMPVGIGKTDLALEIAAPVASIRVVAGPSRPYGPLADGAVAWRAISHLSLNYLSLVDASPAEGAAALRDLLALHAPGIDASARKQIEGVRTIATTRVVRRLPKVSGPLAFGRGLEITVGMDELAFEGGSAYLLGAALSHFFARHVSINSFTETVLRSQSRGEIARWVPEWGARPTL
jgi:type VI secretion system protein ImpG